MRFIPSPGRMTVYCQHFCFFYSQPTAENFKCQKCLEIGHFTFECTGKRKYTYRPSRTKEMVKKMKKDEEEKQLETL